MANISEVISQLINFEIFFKNNRQLGVATIDLPELKAKTASITGAGLSGEIDMPTIGYLESLTLTLNWRNIISNLAELGVQKAVDLILFGAAEMYDHANGKLGVQQIKINVRGIPKNATLGKFEPASTTESKTELEVIYLKISVGGKTITEFDKVNYIYVVNGTDYLAETRAALNI